MKYDATSKRAVGYVRVSTEGQAQEGVSLDAQQAKIRAWCDLSGYELLSIHVDAGLSGCRADNRPALQAALDEACKEGAALVVYSLSRFARSTKDTIAMSERLSKAGADLVSLSEKIDSTSASGKMVFRLLAVMAEFERDTVSERTRTALQHKKARGEFIGMAGYGWRVADDGVSLVQVEEEQEIIRIAKGLRSEFLSLRAIGLRLEEMGFKPRGERWYPTTVRSLLRSKVAAPSTIPEEPRLEMREPRPTLITAPV